MRYVFVDEPGRYGDIKNVEKIILKGGNSKPFKSTFEKWKGIIQNQRKSGKLGVNITLKNNLLTISRNEKQPRPNQNEDFEKVLSMAKRFGFKIFNRIV